MSCQRCFSACCTSQALRFFGSLLGRLGCASQAASDVCSNSLASGVLLSDCGRLLAWACRTSEPQLRLSGCGTLFARGVKNKSALTTFIIIILIIIILIILIFNIIVIIILAITLINYSIIIRIIIFITVR